MSAGRPLTAGRLLFPLAAAYAMVAVPASLASMLGLAPILPGLASPTGHAHEMLFGFALLVVAGHQLGLVAPGTLVALVAAWVLARAAFALAPLGALAALANVAFAALLAARVVPRLFASAKKPRNLALPGALTALAACVAAVELSRYLGFAAMQRAALAVAVVAFSLLMLFMGGRLLAPAAAGQFYRQGGNLAARVQPRIEAALIVLLLVAAIASAGSASRPFAVVAALAMMAAGALGIARLLRWRLWAMHGRLDLLCVGAGYACVAAGLVAWGAAMLAQRHETAMLHLITVGGLGILTLNVMALTAARQGRRDPSRSRLPLAGTLLLLAACAVRILADFVAPARPTLLAVAAAWSAAFALFLVRLWTGPSRPPRRDRGVPPAG